MRDATTPVQLEPGDEITLADIARWFATGTRWQGKKLIATRIFRVRRAAIPPPKPKPPIVPYEERTLPW